MTAIEKTAVFNIELDKGRFVRLVGGVETTPLIFPEAMLMPEEPVVAMEGLTFLINYMGAMRAFNVVDRKDVVQVYYADKFKGCLITANEKFINPLFDDIAYTHSNSCITGY